MHCPACGYCLDGLPAPHDLVTCPECGAPIDIHNAPTTPEWRFSGAFLLIVCGAWPAALAALIGLTSLGVAPETAGAYGPACAAIIATLTLAAVFFVPLVRTQPVRDDLLLALMIWLFSAFPGGFCMLVLSALLRAAGC